MVSEHVGHDWKGQLRVSICSGEHSESVVRLLGVSEAGKLMDWLAPRSFC